MFPASKVGISSKIYQEFVGMKQFTEYIEKFIIKSTNHAKLFVCNKYTVCCMEQDGTVTPWSVNSVIH